MSNDNLPNIFNEEITETEFLINSVFEQIKLYEELPLLWTDKSCERTELYDDAFKK